MSREKPTFSPEEKKYTRREAVGVGLIIAGAVGLETYKTIPEKEKPGLKGSAIGFPSFLAILGGSVLFGHSWAQMERLQRKPPDSKTPSLPPEKVL